MFLLYLVALLGMGYTIIEILYNLFNDIMVP